MKLDVVAVALDFSAESFAALRVARACLHAGGTLRLIHVIDDAVTWRGPTYADRGVAQHLYADLIRGARTALDAASEELRAAGIPIESVVEVGRPADRILAASQGAGLLVVGSQGHGALGRIFLGSVAEEVSRRSAIPTLVVREGAEPSTIERVLVAVDPAGSAGDPIRAASALAQRLGVRLEAIHATHVPPILPYADAGALERLAHVLSAQLESTPARITSLFEKAVGRDVKVHVFTGPPAAAIVRHVSPRDLLVCGTHGRSAFGRLVFGSVATKLLRSAPCPVLVVRSAEDETAG
jgi:nucleotide-binding universal stress UspA family protein